MAKSKGSVIGIDFGTSTTYLAKRTAGGTAEFVPLVVGRRYLPSLAGLRAGGLVIGEAAEFMPPGQVIRSAKRAVTDNRTSFTVATAEGPVQLPRDEVIVAMLREVTTRARKLGQPVDGSQQVRFGCPAMWTRPQRQLIIDLAGQAGLPVSMDSLVEEPVAAGIAWLTGQHLAGTHMGTAAVEGRLLVFDMGGGTLDVAVIDVVGGPSPAITVLTSVGIPLAGDTLDDAITADLRQELASHGIDPAELANPANAEAELQRQARDAKVSLSLVSSHAILLSRRFFGGAKIPSIRYTRERLESALRDQMAASEALIWQALRLARVTHLRGSSTQEIGRASTDDLVRDVDYVLLAGGMSRIPYVRARLAALFPAAEIFEDAGGVDADETVVSGLTDTLDLNTINVYRPGFDVTLGWENGGRLALYDAYTPLFGMSDIHNGRSALGFEARVGERQGIPRQRRGELRVRTASGSPVPLLHRDERIDALAVPFGHYEVRLKIYCDGRVHVTDGAGHDHEVRIDGWPVVAGRDSRPEPGKVPDPVVYYPFNKA
jgi:molecular chaperone DnaK (HSP70)